MSKEAGISQRQLRQKGGGSSRVEVLVHEQHPVSISSIKFHRA